MQESYSDVEAQQLRDRFVFEEKRLYTVISLTVMMNRKHLLPLFFLSSSRKAFLIDVKLEIRHIVVSQRFCFSSG